MASVPFEYGLAVAGVLFVLGLAGVLVRRNLLFILLSVEIMLNAAGLAFIVAGARWGQADGQVMFIFLLSMAAAEVAVGLALILLLYGRRKDLDSDAMGMGGSPMSGSPIGGNSVGGSPVSGSSGESRRVSRQGGVRP
jgi:NADH-quinone oxidoreductase subunit K